MAFGKSDWAQYFGDVGEEPVLPDDINEILDRDCPFWPNKKAKETHLLVLIPAKVNGRRFTLDLLGTLVKNPKQGHSTSYSYDYDESTIDYDRSTIQENFGKKMPCGDAYWALMTRDVVDSSNLKENYLQYEIPTILEAATAILTNYVRSGEWLYETTHTYCQEKVIDPSKSKAETVFVGKSSTDNQLKIGHKIPTVTKFKIDANTNIPPPGRGSALLRGLQ